MKYLLLLALLTTGQVDLRLQVSMPDAFAVQQPAEYHITVSNNGPDAATHVLVRGRHSFPSSVFAVKSDGATCVQKLINYWNWECATDRLDVGAHYEIGIYFIPDQVGNFEYGFGVGADQTEIDWTNQLLYAWRDVTPFRYFIPFFAH